MCDFNLCIVMFEWTPFVLCKLEWIDKNQCARWFETMSIQPQRSKLVSHSNKKYIQRKKIQTTKGHSTQSQNESHNDLHSSS